MAGAIKAYGELSLNLEEHCEQLMSASMAVATSVKVPTVDAIHYSSFQLLSKVPKDAVTFVARRLRQFIENNLNGVKRRRKRRWKVRPEQLLKY